MTLRTLAIVGVGLIGGSIALAARSRRVARHIIGIGPNSEHLEHSRQRGLLDHWDNDLAIVRDADVVVVCAPVDRVAGLVCSAIVHGPQGMLVTDVGSTKAAIVHQLREHLQQGACFVGGHPLAGSDKSGPQFADVRLFENRLVVLTPDSWFAPDAIDRASAFWQSLGARVKVMTPEEHDRAVAMTSHLPHLVAAALAAILPEELRELAASGFRDTTRIAGGDPALWTAIFEQNEGAVADALVQFKTVLAHCLAGGALNLSQVHDLLTEGKRNRDALGS
jgi:prephenate dehydrogenase